MEPKDINRWIEQLFETEADEWSCDQLTPLLPAYAEATAEKRPFHSSTAQQQIDQHLQHCPDCQELFEGLVHVLELEADEIVASPPTAETPAPVAAD